MKPQRVLVKLPGHTEVRHRDRRVGRRRLEHGTPPPSCKSVPVGSARTQRRDDVSRSAGQRVAVRWCELWTFRDSLVWKGLVLEDLRGTLVPHRPATADIQ